MPPPGFFDEAARHNVSAEGGRLRRLGELTIAVVHKDDCVGVGLAGDVGYLLNRRQVKGIALGVAAAALDMHHRGGLGLFSAIRS